MKTYPLNSDLIKSLVIARARFANGVFMIATEAGFFNSDVLYVNEKGELIEVEVKVSKADLVNDFKKRKHTLFKGDHEFIPHKFYFCVPKGLENDALELTKNTSYGVMTCKDWYGSVRGAMDRVITVKRAKNLHERPVSANVKRSIVQRMSSEIANYRLRNALKTEVINNSCEEGK